MKLKIFSSLLLFFSIFTAVGRSAQEYLDSLSPFQRVSQLFLVNIEGNKKYKAVEFEEDGTPVVPGGCLLFSFNISDSADETASFIRSIKEYCAFYNICIPYIAIDQEGGEVNRLRGKTSYLPSQKRVAENYDFYQAFDLYSLQAREMSALGITMNLAPVAEVSSSSNSGFLGSRSFGNPVNTCIYSAIAVNAYESNNIGTVLKHFPGNSNADPHSGLPEISVSKSEFYSNMILPFAFVLSKNPSAVLMSHARIKGFEDENIPGCFSRFWINDILRTRLGYEGLVISDDIFMDALAKNGYPADEAATRAVEAGVEVIMLSEKRFASVAGILLEKEKKDPEFAEKMRRAELKVIEFKMSKGLID